jgi:hypothetical protein
MFFREAMSSRGVFIRRLQSTETVGEDDGNSNLLQLELCFGQMLGGGKKRGYDPDAEWRRFGR